MQRRHTPVGGVEGAPESGSKKVRRVVKKRRKVTKTGGSSSSTTPFKSHFGPEWMELIQLG
eukprot:CAMPEP_0194057738 /NCGR_PEP_ID=MMETSP0009_2-20130614/64088_1 /TAXON_ID=210454 /ORGANISM="Grammatophora oceanica, Strain CCMP 410" /LENGTH=60 /DNA_ID=CAMNT_0038707601 /DNA_START=11 /DNA_END=190 /DNA_ORIENTATION=+